MIAWLKAHGWKLLPVALALGAGLGAFANRKPPPAAVDLSQTRQVDAKGSAEVEQHQSSGPVDVKRRWTLYGPGQAPKPPAPPASPGSVPATPAGPVPGVPCPVVAVLEEEEHRGPVETDTKATSTAEEHVAERLDLRIRPATPSWSLGLGLEDVLGAREGRVAVRYRLGGLGPCVNVWAEGSIRPRLDKPLSSPLGVGLACDVL